MDDQRIFNLLMRAMKKELAFVPLKSLLMIFTANIVTIFLCIGFGVGKSPLPLIFSVINVFFVHFGYSLPKVKEIGAKYKKLLEDRFKKEVTEIFKEYGDKK
jgi:hypothetical protein